MFCWQICIVVHPFPVCSLDIWEGGRVTALQGQSDALVIWVLVTPADGSTFLFLFLCLVIVVCWVVLSCCSEVVIDECLCGPCWPSIVSSLATSVFLVSFPVYVVLLLLPDAVLFVCCWLASAALYCPPFICEVFVHLCVPTCCCPVRALLPCMFLIIHVALWLVQELPCVGVVGGEVLIFVLCDAFVEFTFFFEACWAGSVCGAMSFWVVYAVCALVQAWVCSYTESGSVFPSTSCISVCLCLTVSDVVSEFLAFQTSFWFR